MFLSACSIQEGSGRNSSCFFTLTTLTFALFVRPPSKRRQNGELYEKLFTKTKSG
jgi:hypothetical protein